jgi:hypothetical protein
VAPRSACLKWHEGSKQLSRLNCQYFYGVLQEVSRDLLRVGTTRSPLALLNGSNIPMAIRLSGSISATRISQREPLRLRGVILNRPESSSYGQSVNRRRAPRQQAVAGLFSRESPASAGLVERGGTWCSCPKGLENRDPMRARTITEATFRSLAARERIASSHARAFRPAAPSRPHIRVDARYCGR